MKSIKSICIFCLVIVLLSLTSFGKIDFQAVNQDKIDLETFDIDKQQFFEFVKESILTRQPGLGKYGRVSFYPCDMKLGELKINEHKTPAGKEVRFLSNPSCDQIVIRKVLENSYRYDKNAVTAYKNRQCLLSLEKIISPMLEYYTIKYEESRKNDCSTCEFKEKERLDLIIATQKKIVENCQTENSKVMSFVTELDAQIESGYKAKTKQ
jgi:hypothetical protein